MTRCVCPRCSPIYDPPRKIYRDFYHPQEVPVIHPIHIINRHHCVPVYKHSYCYVTKNEFYNRGCCHHKRRHTKTSP